MLPRFWHCLTLASILWTVAFSLGIYGTVNDHIGFMYWSLMVSLAACLITAHILVSVAVEHGRLHSEELALAMAAAAAGTQQIPRAGR